MDLCAFDRLRGPHDGDLHRGRFSRRVVHRAFVGALALATGRAAHDSVLDEFPHPHVCVDRDPERRGAAERVAEIPRGNQHAARDSLHADRGRARFGVCVSAVHDSPDLQQRGETRRRAHRGRARSRLRTVAGVFTGDPAAREARTLRGSADGVRARDRHVCDHGSDGRRARADDRQRDSEPVFQARDWPFGAALGCVFTLLFVVAYALWQRRSQPIREVRT